ncbi:MAG: S8 family serine peptidase [Lysobacter sp.]|nr:S8 family serine peptidase [Lysobacter sp.]
MARQKQQKKCALATACLMALMFTASNAAYAQENDHERKALEIVAQRLGVGIDELSLQNVAAGGFELQGRIVYSYKIEEKKSNVIHAVSLDESAQEVDLLSLEKREHELSLEKYGRVDRHLAETAERLDPLEPVPVVFWMDRVRDVSLMRPEFASVENPTEDKLPPVQESPETDRKIQTLYKQLDEQNAAIAAESTAAMVGRLRALGYEPVADTGTSSISAIVPAGELRDLSLSGGVGAIYADDEYKPLLSISGNTIGAYQVHAVGNTGLNEKIALVEVGGTITPGNPFLAGVALEIPNPNCSFWHATSVAGVMRSWHGFQRGIGRDASLWSGGACIGLQSLLQTSSTRAVNWGANAINLSFGGNISSSPGSFERFYDKIVQDNWRTVVVAAGNSGLGNRVLNPSQAYNVITVGAFNDRVWPWAMAGFSSSGNPVSQFGDREKPEVVAPGVNIVTTQGTGLTSPSGVSGTSFAAPMVAGAAALVMRRNHWLRIWPESVKSIFMATATANLEGAARLSQHDGAGGINADFADRVAGHGNGTWGGTSYSCASPFLWVVSNVNVQAGRRVRVAMAWDANPYAANTNYSNRPGSDLDMQILAPNNAIVATSLSWDNTYEIVDFVAPMTGTYRLRVVKFSCQHTPKWLGWAWAIM